jgi:hypothetical protein
LLFQFLLRRDPGSYPSVLMVVGIEWNISFEFPPTKI